MPCRTGLSVVALFCLLVSAMPVRGRTVFAPVLEDDLTSAEPVGLETGREVNGGKFVEKGWQATGKKSQMVIVLPEGLFPPDRPGGIEVELTNWDPVNQYKGNKHQFINLYSWPLGSKEGWDKPSRAWWNIRGGTNYMRADGAGIKLLWAPAGIESRGEVRLIHNRSDWDPRRTYAFRVEWTAGYLTLYLDGAPLSGPHDFSGRSEDLRYVFLGTDNVYTAVAGPVYTRLRLLVDARRLLQTRMLVKRAETQIKRGGRGRALGYLRRAEAVLMESAARAQMEALERSLKDLVKGAEDAQEKGEIARAGAFLLVLDDEFKGVPEAGGAGRRYRRIARGREITEKARELSRRIRAGLMLKEAEALASVAPARARDILEAVVEESPEDAASRAKRKIEELNRD